MADSHLGLLNGFHLLYRGRVVRLPLSAQRLLAFLALHQRPLQRTYVAGQLWTDSSQEHANASLRTALWRLRRPGCVLVAASAANLAIADDLAVDVRETSAQAQRVLERRGQTTDLAGLALAGELLPDWYEDWLFVERERFRQLRLHALECLCEDLMAAGRFGEAAEAGLAAVAGEPLRESAHRAVIRVHLAEGNVCEALRQYRLFRSIVRKEFGMEPSTPMTDLVRAFLRSKEDEQAPPGRRADVHDPE